ncbi:MAG: hypothetical protein ACYC23_01150 [Limisphaerales bacterium]
MALILGVQVLLLAWAAVANRHLLNTDAVAYLRLAEYYANGSLDLAVSGYWGPLLSWLVAGMMSLGVPALIAARVVMAASALGFAGACHFLLSRLNIPGGLVRGGTALAALATVPWSVAQISPDLLQGALVLMALGCVLSSRWPTSPQLAVASGFWWGLAYLGKAIALPWGAATMVTVAAIRWFRIPAARRTVGVNGALALGSLLVVVLPWVVVLTLKYGWPTFSTSARIAHAIAGPSDADRYHPFARTFHQPAVGRVTAWEDPSLMPYRHWSPWEGGEAFRHQAQVCLANVKTIFQLVGSIDLMRLGWAGMLGGILFGGVAGSRGENQSWRWLAVPCAWLVLAYLPVAVGPRDERYFFVAWPLLFGAFAGFAAARRWLDSQQGWRRLVVIGALAISFGGPALTELPQSLVGRPDPASEVARDLSGRMKRAGIEGSIAGSGLIAGGRAGLYLAYLDGRRWLGDQPDAGAADYFDAASDLVVVNRRQPVRLELDRDSRFESLDPFLFARPDDPEAYPLKVFRIRR